MKIVVSRNKLVTALGMVRTAIPTKTGTAIMNHALMETTPDALTLTGTNSYSCPAGIWTGRCAD